MAKKRNQRRTVSGELLRAIRECGLSQYEIAKRSGVDPAALSRFVSSQRTLTLPAVDKLADVLGLGLVSRSDNRESKG